MGSDTMVAPRAIENGAAPADPVGIRAEVLARLDLLRELVAGIVDTSEGGDSDHPLRGLFLTRRQAVDLAQSVSAESPARLPRARLGPRLAGLAERCELDDRDLDLLIAASAPDIDPRFDKLYGFLHDDMTRRTASIGLVASLCGVDPTDPADRARFASTGTLVARCLLVVDHDGPFLNRQLRVPDQVVDALLGATSIEPLIAGLIVEPVAVDTVDSPTIGDAIGRSRVVHIIEGIGGAAVHVAHAALAAGRERSTIVDLSTVNEAQLPDVVSALIRHRALTGLIPVVRSVDDLHGRAPDELRRLVDSPGRLVVVGARAWDPAWSNSTPQTVVAPDLGKTELERIWANSLGGVTTEVGAISDVSASFRLTPEQIVRAAAVARTSGRGSIDFAALAAAARGQSASGLDRLARRLEPSATWLDLILPADVTTLLRDLSVRVRRREQVMLDWELGGGWRGRGIAALFSGPSGTGKTTAAEVIADELGYDIHVVDLSSVVDKYIGETEKKLEVIFTEAERTNTVLLFDEADAIFGKRSEVKDARDRYANIEVSYLLQRIERFSGLAILTTNLGANLDEAFTRRLDVVVDFPRPDAAAREQLWRHELRPSVPVGDIDFGFCAEAFDLTGGNIRNIVVTAAYLAADDGHPVAMTHLVAAVQREYRKMGRLCREGEFGPYAALMA